MNRLHKLIGNLQYVSVDRAAAREHWWDMVGFSGLDPMTYSVNRKMVVEQKATAGILSHRQTRGFILHRMKERSLLRRLARKNEPVDSNGNRGFAANQGAIDRNEDLAWQYQR